MSATKRRHPRVPANLEVNLRTEDGQSIATQRIGNISLGGVFIEMEAPLPFGAEVALEFSLPVGPRIIRCKGFVVWSTRTSPERGGGREGVGVRLMDIGIAEMRTLAEFIEHELGP